MKKILLLVSISSLIFALSNFVDILTDQKYRYIKSNGIADHATGSFPNSGNPNKITVQNHTYKLPLYPKKTGRLIPIGHWAFGVAINGIVFDPATAEFYNNDRSSQWNIEALTGGINLGLDYNHAHVQPNGAYHYHGLPTGILNKTSFKTKPTLIGYAADGFAIYANYGYENPNDTTSKIVKLKSSYRVKSGVRSSGPGGKYDGTYGKDFEYVSGLGDLDECNGRFGVTPEYPNGIYYYVITDKHPYVPRCWVGTPDDSFEKKPHANIANEQRRNISNTRQRRDGPPKEAKDVCDGKSQGSNCGFSTPRGKINGTCRKIPEGYLACVPKHHHR